MTARVADRLVVPEACGQRQQTLGRAGDHAAECAGAVASRRWLLLELLTTLDPLAHVAERAEARRLVLAAGGCGGNDELRSPYQPPSPTHVRQFGINHVVRAVIWIAPARNTAQRPAHTSHARTLGDAARTPRLRGRPCAGSSGPRERPPDPGHFCGQRQLDGEPAQTAETNSVVSPNHLAEPTTVAGPRRCSPAQKCECLLRAGRNAVPVSADRPPPSRAPLRNRLQPTASVFARLSLFRGARTCHWLLPVGTALLHGCSIPRGTKRPWEGLRAGSSGGLPGRA
jgi:hypothetical protein